MKIKYLDFRLVSPFSINIFVGRRKSGKTVAIFSFLNHFKDVFTSGIVFCGSVATAQLYANVVPKAFIYDKHSDELIERVIARQEDRIRRGTVTPMFLIFDDLGFDKRSMNSKAMKSLFMNGRHYKICVLISLQYAMSIGPSLRSNVDFVFASREKSPIYRQKLFDSFNLCFKKFAEFDNVYVACTNNYDIFIIANALPTTSNEAEDNLFFWHAKFPIPSFKVNALGAWWKCVKKKKEVKSSTERVGIVQKVGRVTQVEKKVKNEIVLPRLVRRRERGKKFM